ncbi:MAG: C39 family peptidase [Planctomycetota bacterium]
MTSNPRGCHARLHRLLLITPFVLWAGIPKLRAQAKDADSFFVVTKASILGATTLFPPSSNAAGDVVLRLTKAGNVNEIRAFLDDDQVRSDGSTQARLVRTNTFTLNSFPTINKDRTVGSYVIGSGALQVITRYVYSSTTQSWLSNTIARSDPGGLLPFVLLSPITDVDDSGNLFFYGEDQPSGRPLNLGVYPATAEITAPASATYVASTRGSMQALDGYVAVSRSGRAVFRGRGSAGTGIYASPAATAIATDALGFTLTGLRPAVNNAGTVAFLGSNATLSGALLWFAGSSTLRYAGSFGAAASSPVVGVLPQTYQTTARTAVNDLNQILVLATNAGGHPAVFSTNLGVMREILAVGDEVILDNGPAQVTGLSTWGGFNDKGQITLLATVQQGASTDTVVLRTNRAFYQTKVLESPVTPSWRPTPTTGVGYLLRSVPLSQGGVAAHAGYTLAKKGCNLTSTANVLGFFGIQVSPIELQNWLIAKWRAAAAANKARFIVRHVTKRVNNQDVEVIVNDFNEEVVLEYSIERALQQGSGNVVAFAGVFKNQSTAGRENLDAVIAELRAGRPAKLRVPNGSGTSYNRFGHYVLAYGFVDPTVPDAQMTRDSILIHDPGNSGMRTLQDYGVNKGYDTSDAGWFETNTHQPPRSQATKLYRVYRYQSAFLPPATPTLHMTLYSPVEAVVTDPQGRRLGFDPAVGAYQEIPGGLYFSEDSYATLDAETATPLPSWELTEPVTHILIPVAQVAANYDVLLIGTGTGSWSLTSRTAGGSDSRLVSGSTQVGQRQTVRLYTEPPGVVTIGASTPSCNGAIALHADRTPQRGTAAFALVGAAAPPSTAGVFLLGAPSHTPLRALGIDFYLDFAQAFVQLPVASDGAGASRVPLPLPASLARGARVGVQCVWLNTAGCGGAGTLSASEALEIAIQP